LVISFDDFNNYRDEVIKAKPVYIYYQNNLNLFKMNNKDKCDIFDRYNEVKKKEIFNSNIKYENEDYIKMFEKYGFYLKMIVKK